MSTMVAVPVFERPKRVRQCLSTLAEMTLPPDTTIVVFDDCSRTFNPAETIAELSLSAQCERLTFRIGADAMIHRIWSVFLTAGSDHLLILDSDMIANRSALVDGLRLIAGVDGLFSLYNSILHPAIASRGEVVEKDKLGNAGTLWTRDLVRLVHTQLPLGNALDDRYSAFFRSRGIPMASVARSRVQHLGVDGMNNRYYGGLEHGAGFTPDGPAQLAALAEAYDNLMLRQAHFARESAASSEKRKRPRLWSAGARS